MSHEFREYWRVKAVNFTIYLCVLSSVRGMKYETGERERERENRRNFRRKIPPPLSSAAKSLLKTTSSASYIYRKGEQALNCKLLKLNFLPDQFLGRNVAFLNTPINFFSFRRNSYCVCVCVYIYIYTGRFIIFSVITNIYNKKTKGLTLMELFISRGKLKTFSCCYEQFH